MRSNSISTDKTNISPRIAAKPAGIVAALGALGVVFGDIGTSPLYAMGLLFNPDSAHHLNITESNVMGVLSVVFWLVTAVVTIKYATLILRADNHGEGGVMSLYTLLRDRVGKGKVVTVTILTFLGAALFLGDALITPAISLLSAVEGVSVVAPQTAPLIIPIVAGILIALFSAQRYGTTKIGTLFGPAMLIWFTLLGVLGITHIIHNITILRAVNPLYAVTFIAEQPLVFFGALSIILLSVTGTEALYSDLGHFGRKPIFNAWLYLAFPAITLNYFGQGALLLQNPAHPPDNLFYSLVPKTAVIPLVIVATIATVIASQAVISGAFSLASQAVKLDLLPRLRLKYPGGKHGQVYVPTVNWLIFVAVLAIVIVFGSSERLASAYGLSVAACMFIDTILFFWFVRTVKNKPWFIVIPGVTLFVVIDLALLIACLPKIVTGGWMPLAIGSVIFSLFWVWRIGREYTRAERIHKEGSLSRFIKRVNQDHNPRLQGTAIYLHPDDSTVPLSMRTMKERFNILHKHAIIVSVGTEDLPHIPRTARATIHNLNYDDGIFHLQLKFGFNDIPDVPTTIHQYYNEAPNVFEGITATELNEATYYISRFDTNNSKIPGLGKIGNLLFQRMKGLASDPIKFFKLPLAQTITVGAHLSETPAVAKT